MQRFDQGVSARALPVVRAFISIFTILLIITLETQAFAFDCSKAFLPVDFVICSDPQVFKANEEHEAAWYVARSRLNDVQKQNLLESQRVWLREYPPTCGIPARGRRP